MLDNETKRRIDTARDILVGKVPDPKSQVEQITIALVYKFMDDMDKEAIEMGGKPSFFTGDYERYGWSKIFDPRMGGFEMLNLYAEAITRMSQNPKLPELFRNIFKNAYLPYRDPETLKLFLKTINEFKYDHSERLGDAFEYLLSVLGSQGDAGQFRTPRHIIDFMVQIVNPQKHETILDPACGTAGFLISSYKHILKENTKKHPGDLLTPDERKKLLTNFKGYDISPDMVRLSLVNMYLHGFVQPQIIEYDTLTSEDRWNEYADVILANPPFMTPKGGIKPHKRFSVQSNRSEVLFVDYIAEHLTPTGRAAVIVPEGIIFQSANAYKQLRKMLVENHLYAVVSLPAGVFNPYSGVKTSILLMDKQLAKKTDSILFVKIENDGFDLGAQRREIDKNDLPDALNVIKEYIAAVRDGKPETFSADGLPCGALLVKKEKLAKSGEYNLTGDRYRFTETRRHQKWPMVKLGEVCSFEYGKSLPEKNRIPGPFPVMGSNGRTGFHNEYLVEGPTIIIGRKGSSGEVVWEENNCYPIDTTYYVKADTKRVDLKWFYYILKNLRLTELSGGAGIPGLNRNDAYIKEIPLPPLEVQREIVAEIEGYQKLIDGCRQVADAWKPDIQGYLDEELKQYLAEHPEQSEELSGGWKMVKLGEIGKVCMCKRVFKDQTTPTGEIPFYKIGTFGSKADSYISRKLFEEYRNKYSYPKKGEVLISTSGTIGKTVVFDGQPAYFQDSNIVWLAHDESKVLNNYLNLIYQSINWLPTNGVTIARLYNKIIEETEIPLPPLAVQERIVAKIEAERKVIEGCRELIKTYEEKIKRVIDKVWEG